MGLEGFGSMWAEVLLQVLAAASIVALMVIGLVIAKLETGRISVTAVGKEATLRGTAKTVLRSSGMHFDWLLELIFYQPIFFLCLVLCFKLIGFLPCPVTDCCEH